jgi:CIC family chloride channel protein
MFYNLRGVFRALPVSPSLKPAIGGMGVDVLALGLPQILGGGSGWIQEAIDSRLTAGLLLALLFAKILAFALTISSGGSGGVFALSLFVGAMVGGFLATVFHQPSAAFVIVGMVAVIWRRGAGADRHALDGDGKDRRLSPPGASHSGCDA